MDMFEDIGIHHDMGPDAGAGPSADLSPTPRKATAATGPDTLEMPAISAAELSEPRRPLDDLCSDILEYDDALLACVVVDLSTGHLLSCSHKISYFDQAFLDMLSVAVVTIFRGQEVQRIEAMLSKFRKEEVCDTIEDVFFKTGNVFHFMRAIPRHNAAFILVTKSTINQGMGWHIFNRATPKIEAAAGIAASQTAA